MRVWKLFSAFCLRAFYLVAGAAFCYVALFAMLWNRADKVGTVLATVGSLVILFLLWRGMGSHPVETLLQSPCKRRAAVMVLILLFAGGALVSVWQQVERYSGTNWDIWVIHAQAQELALSPRPTRMTYADYFLYYPNNDAILMLFTGWYRLGVLLFGPSVDFNWMGALLAAAAMVGGQLCSYGAAKNFFGHKAALFSMVCWLLVPAFYAYAVTPYTDTIGLFLCSLVLLLLSLFYKSHHPGWAAAAGMAAGAALRVKGSAAVFLVAMVIFLVFLDAPLRRKLAALVLAGVFAAAAMWGIMAFFTQSGYWGEEPCNKEEWQIPVTHWLMMAQNPEGPYVESDVEFSKYLWGTYEYRTQRCWEVFQDRVSSRSAATNLIFTNRRMVAVWGDGTFQVNQYDRNTYYRPDSPLRKFYQEGTASYEKFRLWANGMHFAMLLAVALGLLHRVRTKMNRADGAFLLQLVLFGFFLLELVWEWRSRYLFSYVPAMVLLLPTAMVAAEQLLCRKNQKS